MDGQTRHVLSYLKDFLFTPERARQPVKALSGGERNRLLLAKLFTRPANLLVLDEPTNDLDTETLELLEDLLVEFQGHPLARPLTTVHCSTTSPPVPWSSRAKAGSGDTRRIRATGCVNAIRGARASSKTRPADPGR